MVASSYFSPLLLFLLSSVLAVLVVLLLSLSATPLSDEVAADCGRNDNNSSKKCT